MKGIVDRIVDGEKVVILVGEKEEEYILNQSQLSFNVKEGSVLEVNIENGQLDNVKLIKSEDEQRITNKLELLRNRSGESKFKKK
ncbi:DUF3006 family protein [Bacillus sp. FJAT-45350]|uniref:DUF3006 family protein n=1 Tax=Bacillus sp. FJAT-45350 TaxID=2011014 RepID=UPI000BB98A81|nr:DUF3006 family protein [Bacillus sp. FJAT-45350]